MKTGNRVQLRVEQLVLNTDNPRFEGVRGQNAAISSIVNDAPLKLFNLAEHICKHGLSASELLIVMREPSKSSGLPARYIVLEGNRRVTALKLLFDPSILLTIDKKLHTKFNRLSSVFLKKPIDEVECIIYDNLDDAYQWIKLKHSTGNDGVGTVKWDPIQRDRFESKFLGKHKIGLQILDFLSQHASKGTFEPGQIQLSTLERIVKDPEVQRIIGISVMSGKIYTSLPPEEVLKPLTRIATDCRSGGIKVRDVYYKEDRQSYLSKFPDKDLPIFTNTSSDPWPILDSHANRTVPAAPARRKASISPSDRSTVVPRGERIHIPDPKISLIYKELGALDCSKHPIAAAFCLRAFFELSVDAYLEKHNLKRKGDWKSTSYNALIERTILHLIDQYGAHEADLKYARIASSGQNQVASIDTMHAYVHNRNVVPDPVNLKAAWDQLCPFFKLLWETIER